MNYNYYKMLQSIKAKKLQNVCSGFSIYDVPKEKTDSAIDTILKNIYKIQRTNFGFEGLTQDSKWFEVNILDGKITGLLGKTKKINNVNSYNRSSISLGNKRFNTSKLIACLDLLSNGYYVDDWSILGVNHKDNSAGRVAGDIGLDENINPESLELYLNIKGKARLNSLHYKLWETIYTDYDMLISFSLYDNTFYSYIIDCIAKYDKEEVIRRIKGYSNRVENGIYIIN